MYQENFPLFSTAFPCDVLSSPAIDFVAKLVSIGVVPSMLFRVINPMLEIKGCWSRLLPAGLDVFATLSSVLLVRGKSWPLLFVGGREVIGLA